MSDSDRDSVVSEEEKEVVEDLSNSDVVAKYRLAASIAQRECLLFSFLLSSPS